MPEVNHVPFKYDPVPGDLYLDSFRQMFYMERLDEVKEALQFLSVAAAECPLEVRGELFFSDAEGEPPQIRGLHLSHASDRAEMGNPYPRRRVTLWPDDGGSVPPAPADASIPLSKDCPECGENNEKIAETCRRCGGDLSDVTPARH